MASNSFFVRSREEVFVWSSSNTLGGSLRSSSICSKRFSIYLAIVVPVSLAAVFFAFAGAFLDDSVDFFAVEAFFVVAFFAEVLFFVVFFDIV